MGMHHVGVTTMERLDQSSLHPVVKASSNLGASSVEGKYSIKELASQFFADKLEPLHNVAKYT
jgi:hypothetical protein